MPETATDVVVIGGGFAGLSAAFRLGRFRRSGCVLDTGAPRNEATWAVHGFPALANMPTHEIRRRIRDQALGTGADLETAMARAALAIHRSLLPAAFRL